MPATQKETRVVEIRIDARQFSKATRDINSNLEKMRKQSQRTSDAIAGIIQGFLSFQGIQLTRELVMATAEVERLDSVMRGAVGDAEDYADSMEFLRDMAEEFGLALGDLQPGFAQLAAAGQAAGLRLEEIEELFRGLAVSAAAFQVSGSELNLMLYGAQQLAGGAVVNMEDLRQVMDRIPNAMGAAVSATRDLTGDLDLSAQEMRELIAQGKIATDEWLPLFTARLEELNLDAAANNADTFRAALNRLTTAFQELLRTLVQAGVLKALAEAVELMEAAVVAIDGLARGQSFQTITSRITGASEQALAYSKAMQELTEAEQRLAEFNAASPRGSEGLIGDLILGMQGITPEQRRAQYESGVEAARARLQGIADTVNDDAFWAAQEAEQERLMRGFVPGGQSAAQMIAEQNEGVLEQPFATTAGGAAGGGGGGRTPTQQVEDYTDAIRSLRAELDPLVAAQQDYTDTMVLLNSALEAGQISQAEFSLLASQSAEQLHEAVADLEETTSVLPDLAEGMGLAFSNAFGEMITGASSFEDALRSLEAQLISTITQALVLAPLEKAITTGASSFFSGLGLPGFADGGNIRAGQASIVGERGPEIFVPRSSGTIVPNEAMGNTTIINFNAPVSGEGLRQSAQQIAASVGAQTARAAARNG